MMLCIDCHLNVVTHQTSAARLHGAGIGIGQGDLFVRRAIELNLNLLELLHFDFQSLDLAV